MIGFKTNNIALKNTPQQNPKEYKTKTEKQAKENDGKTSSIINLLDEIDTTLYIINDKLDETPEIMLGKGILSGGVLTKEGLSRMKIPEIKEELKNEELNLNKMIKKTNLLERLEVFIKSRSSKRISTRSRKTRNRNSNRTLYLWTTTTHTATT